MLRSTPRFAAAISLSALWLSCWAGTSVFCRGDASPTAAASFHEAVKPLLVDYCYDCHGDGMRKGKVAFDGFASDTELLAKTELWLAVLKNVRAGIMPPDDGPRPTPDEIKQLEQWIKYQAFGIDPANPDPGHVTVRRLNRIEYRNTIRDLMGIDFNSEAEFPPDDTGHGFDNLGDVLSLSPLHLEKYLAAADTIVATAVPKVSRVMAVRSATGAGFRDEARAKNGSLMSVYEPHVVSRAFDVEHTETYRIVADLEVRGSFDFDPGRARLIFSIDGEKRFEEEIAWDERRWIRQEFTEAWIAGRHRLTFELQPLQSADSPVAAEPAASDNAAPVTASTNTTAPSASTEAPKPPKTFVNLRIASVQVRGPIDEKHWVAPANYARFFPDGAAPDDPAARLEYARVVLRRFATRAFRRPVEETKVEQLAALARSVYDEPGKTFEEGVARAMMAVLASPRFLFRVEHAQIAETGDRFPLIDDYALASRLSYFLWSTMPDEELFRLASRGELRRELPAQVRRMLKDERAQAFVRNFVGQWLQARDVEFVPVNALAVLGPKARKNKEGRIEFGSRLRKAMRSETEMLFEHVLREDRSVLEFLNSNYTFLNEELAAHYGIPDVVGETMRLVNLPEDSPRGGVLTQGTILTVTSNPTRTSPVKRGLFVLENILGTPPPPPPDIVPDLEEAKKEIAGGEPTLREMLAVHRENALCSSCHSRMDPLGLALENFTAMGTWRDTEAKKPVEPAGQLITGERFADIRELKRILTRDRRIDFYRCLTEKLLTYALGRGLEHYDVHTVDELVQQLEQHGGKFSVLLDGIVQSTPFQKTRRSVPQVSTSREPPERLTHSRNAPAFQISAPP